MKVVNKWNRRFLRAVRGQRAVECNEADATDDRSIGSSESGDICITDNGTHTVQRRTREAVLASLPEPGQLSQLSSQHLDLLYALACPKRADIRQAEGKSEE
jgi:hypothetical protein